MTAPLELPEAILREHMPDDDIVLGYVTRGTMAQYIEGVAAVNPDFRDELEACIEGLEDAGEPISAAARAWRMPAGVVVPFARPSRKANGGLLRYTTPLAIAAAIALVAGGAYMKSARDGARAQAMKDQEIAAKQAEVERLMADLKAQQAAMQTAQAELTRASNEADRAAAQSKLAAAEDQQRKTRANIAARSAAGPAKSGGAKAACNCQPGDPLCSCL